VRPAKACDGCGGQEIDVKVPRRAQVFCRPVSRRAFDLAKPQLYQYRDKQTDNHVKQSF
jgi:hypothetical protein